MLLAASIDLLGYSEYYNILYDKLELTMSSITATYFLQHDKKRRADQLYGCSRGWITSTENGRRRCSTSRTERLTVHK
jgi:hypothetical protein